MGLKLPEGWSSATDNDSGDVYYYNTATNEVSWDPPPGSIEVDDEPPQQRKQNFGEPQVQTTQAGSNMRDTVVNAAQEPLALGITKLIKTALLFPFTGVIPLVIYLSVRGVWALILLISGLASLGSDSGAGNEQSQFLLFVDGIVMVVYSALLVPILWSPAHTILENQDFSLDGNLYNLLINIGGQKQPYKRFYLGLFIHAVYRIYCVVIGTLQLFHFSGWVPTRNGKFLFFHMVILGFAWMVNLITTVVWFLAVCLFIAIKHYAPRILELLLPEPEEMETEVNNVMDQLPPDAKPLLQKVLNNPALIQQVLANMSTQSSQSSSSSSQ